MRRIFPNVILSAVLAAALTPGALLAQTSPQTQDQTQPDQQQAAPAPDQQGPPPMPGRGMHKPPNPRREAKHMAKMLNLSPDQESRLEPIFANRQQQAEAVRADSTLSPDQRKAKMQTITADANSQITQVLTDQQNQQWQQMKAQRRAQKQQQQQQGAPANG